MDYSDYVYNFVVVHSAVVYFSILAVATGVNKPL
jgi:hypothetical protein